MVGNVVFESGMLGNGGELWEVVGNGGKWCAMLGNYAQWWEIKGNGVQWWEVVGSSLPVWWLLFIVLSLLLEMLLFESRFPFPC
jgi:hypothetical protein